MSEMTEILQFLLTKEALFLYLGFVVGIVGSWIVCKTSSKGLRKELELSVFEKNSLREHINKERENLNAEKEHLRRYFYSEIVRIQKEKDEQKQSLDKVVDSLMKVITKITIKFDIKNKFEYNFIHKAQRLVLNLTQLVGG